MIAYLEGKNTTVDVPDDTGTNELNDIQNNFEKYVQPEQTQQSEPMPKQSQVVPSNTTEVPKMDIPTGIPGVNIPRGTSTQYGLDEMMPKWVPNFYESWIKPTINAIGPFGLPAQLESLPEEARGPVEAFATSSLKGLTGGLAKPLLSGYDTEEKDHPVAAFGGELTGNLGSLLATGGALKIAGLGEVAEEAGKAGVEAGLASAQRYIPRAIMTGATFGTQTFVAHTIKAFQDGNVDIAQFGKDVLAQTAGGAVFGGIGGIANVPVSVASAGGLGFVMSKMEGGDNREAALNAGLFAGFEMVGSFGKNKALIDEGLRHVEDSIDDYVKAKDPTINPNGGMGKAIVTLEAQKYGGVDALSKKENALQLIEDINQKIRQGKVPAPIQTQASAELPSAPSEPSEQTSPTPTPTSPRLPQETGPEQAQLQGEVYPASDVSSNPMVSNHPDFIQLKNDATAVVNKYAEERNVAPTREFAESMYRELHDVLGKIRRADTAERPAVIAQIKQEFPDIEREFATLHTMEFSDVTDNYFQKQVAGKYGSMRPKVATEAEAAQQASMQKIQEAVQAETPNDVFNKTAEAIQGVLPKEPKQIKFDERGIPIRKPNSVVAMVPTQDGGVAKITHKMILDEAEGLLKEASDVHGTPHPLAEFVRQNGGIKGFKGGMESEEFQKVPIHMRGIVSADEMAQMAYDRNLLDEPSADLLRNELSTIKPKGEKPVLANYYDQAQRNLEEHFSNFKSEQEPDWLTQEQGGTDEVAAENRASYGKILERQRELEGLKAAVRIPATNNVYTGANHDEIWKKIPSSELADFKKIDDIDERANNVGFVDVDGNFISRREADKRYGISDTLDAAKQLRRINRLKEPGVGNQQELNFNSPYEEDQGNQVPNTQGEAAPSQPTVRGGFKAIQEPHLEVEFKQNGFLVFPNRKINSPADLAYGFKFLHNEAQENFFIGAIKDDRIVSVEHLAVGTIDQVAVYPYETINHIDRANADSFFIVHNHPSGEVVPSEEDKNLTNNLRKVMDQNGIEFKGHVIIDDTKFGFIDPDGATSQVEHHTGPATNQVPIVKKFYQWLRPKSDLANNPVVSNPKDAFEIFKGIQRGRTEAIVHLLDVQNKLLNSIVVPQNQVNAGVIQRLATSYRAASIIAVNSGLSDDAYMKMLLSLKNADIRVLDDVELSDDKQGFRTKRGRGVFEQKAEYGNEEKYLFPENKENVADRYARLRQEAIAQGMNPAQASKYAKDAMASKVATPSGVKLKQQEFGATGGVEGFGQGREGEQSLFEPKGQYGEKEISQQMKDAATEIHNVVNPSAAHPLAAQITREQLGKMARSYDKAEATLRSARDMFEKQTTEQKIDFIDKMERGMVQTTPALEKIAKQLRILLDEKRTEIRALGTGKLDQFIENYFPHLWDQSEKQVTGAVMKAAKRPFEGSKSFLKKRTIEFFKDGISYGLTPITFNPVENVLLKAREMDKYLMAHRTMQAYKENGLMQFVKLGADKPSPDWIKIDDKVSTVMRMTDEGLVLTGHYYAQPDAARIINNYLSPGLQKSAIYQAFRYAGNMLNQFQLGFSAFHLGFTSMEAIVSKNALALNQLFKGHPFKAMMAAISSPAAPIANIIRGDKLFKAWRGEGRSPDDEVMAQAMASGGGRAQMDQFYATKAFEQMKKLFQAGKPIRGILHIPLSIVEATTKPILEYVVPRQKLGIFSDIMRMEMEHNPEMTHDQMRQIAQKAWDSVDNRMGQMVYDNIFWNRTFKDLLMASVRSVGWNLGDYREFGGGTIDAVSMLKDLAKGKKTNLSYRTAYIISVVITSGIAGAIYQYLKTGKGPQELKDYFHPRNGGTDSYGNPTRTDLPTYMKDVFAYTSDPIKTLENKLNPLLAIIGQMLNNKDYFGTKIRNEDDPITKQVMSDATFILKQLEPFSIRNMQRNREQGNKTTADTIEPWIGFTPARYDINQTKAEKLAHEFQAAHQEIGGRTQEQVDRSKLANQFERRYRAGDETVQDEMAKAYEQGLISKNQMRNIFIRKNMTPLQKAVQHLTAEETQRVYDKSTDEEKAQIQRQLDKKVMKLRVPQEVQ